MLTFDGRGTRCCEVGGGGGGVVGGVGVVCGDGVDRGVGVDLCTLSSDFELGLLISVLLFKVCEEASKMEQCPSEIILDNLLALDSI
nr:hypothetical protein [Tanacetum cinerariifolium]